jgi:hypothetical protein
VEVLATSSIFGRMFSWTSCLRFSLACSKPRSVVNRGCICRQMSSKVKILIYMGLGLD